MRRRPGQRISCMNIRLESEEPGVLDSNVERRQKLGASAMMVNYKPRLVRFGASFVLYRTKLDPVSSARSVSSLSAQAVRSRCDVREVTPRVHSTLESLASSQVQGPARERSSTIKTLHVATTPTQPHGSRSNSRVDLARSSARLGVRRRVRRSERPSDTPLRLGQEQACQCPHRAGRRLPAAMDIRSTPSPRRDPRRVRQLATHSRRRRRRRLDFGGIAVRSEDCLGRLPGRRPSRCGF